MNFKGGKIKKECKHCGGDYLVFLYRKNIAKFCSRKCLASSRTKKTSAHWKGGISEINKLLRGKEEYNNWRKSVYARDFFTCQDCKIKQKYPIAHHLKSWKEYPEFRYDIDNGITLCRSCHKKVHKNIGEKTRFIKKEQLVSCFDATNGILTIT